MEGVPRLPMLKVDLKLLQDHAGTDWIDNASDESLQEIITDEINKHIQNQYSDDPKKYKDCISNFLELQSAAHRVLNAPDMEGCNTLKKYYGQLHFMQSRFPFVGSDALNVPFAWSDAFTERYTQHTSFIFEQSAILFNLGSIHSYLGSIDMRVSEEGTKISCVHFQCAAGFFQYLADHIDTTLAADSSQFMLKLYTNTMLGQGQECLLEKSMQDNRKNSIIAKIAQQVVEYYEQSLSSLNQSEAKQAMSDANKTWQRLLSFKIAFYSAIVKYYLGADDWEQEKYGSGLSYFGAAIASYNDSVKLAKNLKGDFRSRADEALTYSADVFTGRHTSAKKDNEFVYHEKVPDPATLPIIKGASLVKALPFDPSNTSVSGPDLFSKLVPLEAHLTASSYSEEKAKLLRPILAEVEEKDAVLDQYKQAIELDPSKLIKADEEDRLDPLLVEHCAVLSVDQTPLQELTKAIKELSDVYMDTDSLISEVDSLIQEEENEAKQVKDVCGKTVESTEEIERLKKELEVCKEVHEKAGQMNDDLHTAMKVHISNLKVVSEGLDKLKLECKFANVSELITDEDTEVITSMGKLCSKVAEMESQRQSLVAQLRAQLEEDDVTSALMTNPGIDAEDLFKEELKKHETVMGYIKQNLAAQENILNAVTEANVRYVKIKKVVDEHKKKTQSKCGNFLHSCTGYTAAVKRCDEGTLFFKELHDRVGDVNEKIVKLNEKNSKLRKIIIEKHEVRKPPPRPTAPKPKSVGKPANDAPLFSAAELAEMAAEDMDEFNDPAFLNYLRMSGGLPSGMPLSSAPPQGAPPNRLSGGMPHSTPHGLIANAAQNLRYTPAHSVQQSGFPPHRLPTSATPQHFTMTSMPGSSSMQQVPAPDPNYNSYSSNVPQPQAVTLGQKPIMSSQQVPSRQNPANYQPHGAATLQSRFHSPTPGYSAPDNFPQPPQSPQAMHVGNHLQQRPQHPVANPTQHPLPNQAASYVPQQSNPGYQSNQAYPNQQPHIAPPTYNQVAHSVSQPPPVSATHTYQRFPVTTNAAGPPMSQNTSYSGQPQYTQPMQEMRPPHHPQHIPAAPRHPIVQNQNYAPALPQGNQSYSGYAPAPTRAPVSHYAAQARPPTPQTTAPIRPPTPQNTAPIRPPTPQNTAPIRPQAPQNASQLRSPPQTFPGQHGYVNQSDQSMFQQNLRHPTHQTQAPTPVSNAAAYSSGPYSYPPNPQVVPPQNHQQQSHPANQPPRPQLSPQMQPQFHQPQFAKPASQTPLGPPPSSQGHQPPYSTTQANHQQAMQPLYHQQQMPQNYQCQTTVAGNPPPQQQFQPAVSHQPAPRPQHPGFYGQSTQAPARPPHNSQPPSSHPNYQPRPSAHSPANAKPMANQQRFNQPQQYTEQKPQNWQQAPSNHPVAPQNAAQRGSQPVNQKYPQSPAQSQPPANTAVQPATYSPQPVNQNHPKNAPPMQAPKSAPANITKPLSPTVVGGQTPTPSPFPSKPSADLVGLTYIPSTDILMPTSTKTSADELLTTDPEPDANVVREAKPLLVPTKVDSEEMVVTRIDSLPYHDEADLMKFKNDTEIFQRRISTLLTKQQGTLCQLDKDWKQLSESQEKSARQQSTAVGRCSSYKNRFQDILPFDQNRVVLLEAKDDYINASLVDDVNKYCPRFIATQSPLTSSCSDFWTMIHEQQVTLIVMLVRNNDVPKKCAMYWPENRNVALKHGPLSITFTTGRSHESYEERTFTLKHANSSLPRSLTQLQYTAWPEHGHPSSLHDLLSFMDVVHNYHSQQRSLQWPIVVHCENGISHTGSFCSAYACVKYIDAGLGIPDILEVISKMRRKRKNMVQEKTQLKFVHDLVSIRAVELLKQRGVTVDSQPPSNQISSKQALATPPVATKNAFDVFDSTAALSSIQASVEKLTVKGPTSDQPLTSASSALSISSQAAPAPVDINAMIGNNVIDLVQGTLPDQQSPPSVKPDVISDCRVPVHSAYTDSIIQNSGPSPSNSAVSAGEAPGVSPASMNAIQATPSNLSILDQLTPESFTLGTDVKEKKRTTKADFFRPKSSASSGSNESDPFSGLDPLWGFKK